MFSEACLWVRNRLMSKIRNLCGRAIAEGSAPNYVRAEDLALELWTQFSTEFTSAIMARDFKGTPQRDHAVQDLEVSFEMNFRLMMAVTACSWIRFGRSNTNRRDFLGAPAVTLTSTLTGVCSFHSVADQCHGSLSCG